jgi:hypothetical protein
MNNKSITKNNIYAQEVANNLWEVMLPGSVVSDLLDVSISDEEFMYYLRLEQDREMPKFDFKFLIETFPEAKSLIIDNLKQEINVAEMDLLEADRLEKLFDDIIYRKTRHEYFWKSLVTVMYLEPLRIDQHKIIKRNTLYLSMLSGKSSTKNQIGVTPEEIAQAKQYPLTELIEFKIHQAVCPFHQEKTPSLHYYPKNNSAYCFGACQKAFDSIEAYRQLNHCSFVEAVRKLI